MRFDTKSKSLDGLTYNIRVSYHLAAKWENNVENFSRNVSQKQIQFHYKMHLRTRDLAAKFYGILAFVLFKS